MAFWNRHRDPAPVVAATEPLQPGWRRTAHRVRQGWQERAEFFAENLGAVRFASGLMADASSRCTLRVERNIDPRQDLWEPADQPVLQDLLHVYRGKDQSQAELIRQHIWQYQTVGEAYQITETDGRHARFSIRSPFACVFRGHDQVLVMDIPGGTERDGSARVVPIEQVRRLWMPNETWPLLAVSPLKGVLRDCERYWSLQRRMQRVTDSALGMGKILWTPDEAHTKLAREQAQPDNAPGTVLERDYYAVASRNINDDDSVEAIVPTMWRWSKDFGEPKTIDLATTFDSEALNYRKEALECIGRGLNYPQRLLVDDGKDSNHWGAWLLEEQFVKNSVVPILERVVWRDLTESFLRPSLRAVASRGLWEGNPEDYRIGFDTTPIVVHPDQSKLAIQLYTLGVLSDRELLERTGFDSTAAPNREELGRWIVRTQIGRERITAPNSPVLPGDASTVLEQTPQTDPGAVPALAALSVVRETVKVGPYESETVGWLD